MPEYAGSADIHEGLGIDESVAGGPVLDVECGVVGAVCSPRCCPDSAATSRS